MLSLLLLTTCFSLNLYSYSYPSAIETELDGISSAGDVVGFFADQAGVVHGFLVNSRWSIQIDVPGATGTYAIALNSENYVVGRYTDHKGETHGFVWFNNATTQLDYPGGTMTWANAVNDEGIVLGNFFNTEFGIVQGFIYESGKFSNFSYPGAVNTQPFAISDSGYIAGSFNLKAGNSSAFILEPNGNFIELHLGENVTQAIAYGINNNCVVGTCAADTDVWSAFMLCLNGKPQFFRYPGATQTSFNGINQFGAIVGDYYSEDLENGMATFQ